MYVTYIKTTPEKLWHALTDPDVMQRWRFGTHAESDWRVGSSWKMITEAGQILDTGEVVESTPPTRLVITWRSEWEPELRAEGYSHCTFDIEPVSSTATALTVTHAIEKNPSPFIEGVSIGWPKTLSKSEDLSRNRRTGPGRHALNLGRRRRFLFFVTVDPRAWWRRAAGEPARAVPV